MAVVIQTAEDGTFAALSVARNFGMVPDFAALNRTSAARSDQLR
ncbi:hypothetical protein [Sandarakinorhabdus glacialis]|nr:hypothetical protein [Polymorphobacter glacialis]